MNDSIEHPEAAQLIESLVASGGGHLAYEFGAPGREIAVAAGAHLAARTGLPLTVIDFRHLLPQIRNTVAELHPDLACTLLAAGEAVQRPRGHRDGVLVVHAELLHNPGVRDALLARAAAAERLVVASRADAEPPGLNALPGPRHRVKAVPPVLPNGLNPATYQRFEADVADPGWIPADFRERKERLIRQIVQRPAGAEGRVNFEEFDISPEELTQAPRNAAPGQPSQDDTRVPVSQSTTEPAAIEENERAASRPPGSGLPAPTAARLASRLGEHRIDTGAREGAAAEQRSTSRDGRAARSDESELTDLLNNVDPEQLADRIAQLKQRSSERPENHPTPTRQQQNTHPHAQEQSAAHQQQGRGHGLT